MECLFCKIASKENSALVINENDDYIAFLDIYPKSNGHTLVIPKNHSENIFEMSDYNGFLEFVKETKAKIDDVLSPDGYYIRSNAGETAGQVIFHTHMHVIPTYKKEVENIDPNILIKEF